MIDRYLCKDISGIFNFFNKFQTDRTADTLQIDLFKDMPWDQAKVTIYIADVETKEEFYKVVICCLLYTSRCV